MLQATRTLVIALLCISCSPSAPPLQQPQPPESPPTPALAKASDVAEADHQAALSIVRSADRVETFRVRSRLTLDDTRRAKDPQFADKYLDHLWPIEKRGPVLSQDFARKLEAFLLDESNCVGRTPGGDKACIFSPGVVFQFRNGSDLGSPQKTEKIVR